MTSGEGLLALSCHVIVIITCCSMHIVSMSMQCVSPPRCTSSACMEVHACSKVHACGLQAQLPTDL